MSRHVAPPNPGRPDTRHPRRWLAAAIAGPVLLAGLFGAGFAATAADDPPAPTWSDRLGAEGATIDAQIAALEDQIASLTAANATVTGERDDLLLANSDLQTQVDALQAEVDRLKQYEPTPSPTPSASPASPSASPSTTTPPALLVGSSLYSGTNESPQQSFDRRCNTWGVCPEVVRYFFSGLPSGSWPTFGVAPTPTVVSFKVPNFDMAGFAAGNYDSQVMPFLQTVPNDGRTHYITVWHEPEDDIAAGHFTAAQYRNATTHLQLLVSSFDGTGKRLRVGEVLMGWTVDPRSGRNVNDYLVPSLDFIGWDIYTGLTTAEVQRDFQPAANVCDAQEAGKCFLTETAPNSAVKATQAQKATYLRVSAQVARDLGFDAYMYFDSTVGGDFRLTDQVAFDAIAAEIRK